MKYFDIDFIDFHWCSKEDLEENRKNDYEYGFYCDTYQSYYEDSKLKSRVYNANSFSVEIMNDIYDFDFQKNPYNNDYLTFIPSIHSYVCEDCLDENYTECCECGEYVLNNDVWFSDDTNEYYCEYCFNETHVYCEECDNVIDRDDNAAINCYVYFLTLKRNH
jgi:hypothetical protein